MLPRLKRQLTINYKLLAIILLFTFLSFFWTEKMRAQGDDWFVTEGGDLHAGTVGDPGQIQSLIPGAGTCTVADGCTLNHYDIKGLGPPDLTAAIGALSLDSRFETGAGIYEPGVVSYSTTLDSGAGAVSSQAGWDFSGTDFDEERIKYNYAYFERLFNSLPDCVSPGDEHCVANWDGTLDGANGLLYWRDTSLPAWIDGGDPEPIGSRVYKTTQDVVINWSNEADFESPAGLIENYDGNWVITGGDRITLLVDGEIAVKKGIRFQAGAGDVGGMLAVIASHEIGFHSDLRSGEESGGSWIDTGQRVGGVFVSDTDIVTCSDDSAAPAAAADCDDQVLFGGIYVAWGTFELNRDLGALNDTAPSEVFVYIPEFCACLPSYFKRPLHYWEEQVPD